MSRIPAHLSDVSRRGAGSPTFTEHRYAMAVAWHKRQTNANKHFHNQHRGHQRVAGRIARLAHRPRYGSTAPIGAFGIPPMMGGSPYATRETGWHADGCLCRACSR